MEKNYDLKIINEKEDDKVIVRPIKKRDNNEKTTLSEIRKWLEDQDEIEKKFCFVDDDTLVNRSDENKLLAFSISKPLKNELDREIQITPIIEKMVSKESKIFKDNYYEILTNIAKDDFECLLKKLNFCYGIKYENEKMSFAHNPIFDGNIPEDYKNKLISNDYTVIEDKIAKSSSLFSLVNFGFTEVDANLSVPWIGIHGFLNSSSFGNSLKGDSKSVKYTCMKVCKGILKFDNFRKINLNFENYFENKEISEKTINQFLDDYGAYVIDSAIIGGQLYNEVTSNSLNTENENGSKLNISGGVNSESKFHDVNIKGTKEDMETKKTVNWELIKKGKITNKGGDSNKVQNKDDWMKSLSDFRTWDIIEISKWQTTIDLLPEKIKTQITNFLNSNYKTNNYNFMKSKLYLFVKEIQFRQVLMI